VRPRAFTQIRAILLFLASWLIAAQNPLLAQSPAHTGYVNDFASVLDDAAETYLETFLGTLERDTSAEVVVATVASLEGMTIEEYASRLFADWGIGTAQHDNGVLLLVAPRERAVRIEVGYGLEPILPDGLAGEIIRTEILPEFRAGNVPRGIGRGLNRISQIVRGDPAAAARPASTNTANDLPPQWFVIPFFATFVVLGSFAAGLGLRTKTYGPLVAGGVFVGIPLLLATVATSVFSLAVFVLLGVAAVAVEYRRGQSAYWMGMLRTGRPDTVRNEEASDWVMGGAPGSSSGSSGSGGSDSGGSSSSSGDSGGGSSGGGGASGNW